MKITVCDICGKPVSDKPVYIEFYSDRHNIFIKWDVHKGCYENLITKVREMKR